MKSFQIRIVAHGEEDQGVLSPGVDETWSDEELLPMIAKWIYSKNTPDDDVADTPPMPPQSPSKVGMYSVPMMSELTIIALPPFSLKLQSIPAGLTYVRTLEYLHLECHEIPNLSARMGSLKGLRVLKLPHNAVKTVPADLRHCRHLHTLVLNRNVISTLPDGCLGSLPLETLNLASNNLSSLPSDFAALYSSLTSLNISNNRLASFPLLRKGDGENDDNASEEMEMVYLNLNNNMIQSFSKKSSSPPPVLHARKLETLLLSNNRIVNVPVLSHCSALVHLDLSNNRLSEIPDHLQHLGNLEILNLSSNNIVVENSSADSSSNSAPSSIHFLSSLTRISNINLSRNDVKCWNVDLSELSRLEKLDVSFNALEIFHGNLPSSLCDLNLSHNHLKSLPFDPVFMLENLLHLNLSYNELVLVFEPPRDPRLNRLKRLELSYNRLKSVPACLLKCHTLEVLWLEENPLTEAPPIHDLPELKSLRLASSFAVIVPDLMPDSLHELTMANIRINDTLRDVSIIKQPGGMSPDDPEFVLSFLLATTRASGHPLVAFAVAQLSECDRYQSLLARADGVRKIEQLFNLITACKNPLTAFHCARALFSFLSQPRTRRAFLESNLLPPIVVFSSKIASADAHCISMRIELLKCARIVSSDSSLAAMACIQLYGLDVYDGLLSDEAVEVRRETVRLLRAIGAHDLLHFGRLARRKSEGVRILALDGGGSRGIVTVILMQRIERITGRRLHEMFDLVCGTSAGAIMASLVALRHASTEEMRLSYERTLHMVFGSGSSASETPNTSSSSSSYFGRIFSLMYVLRTGAYYKTTPLVELIREHAGCTDPTVQAVLEQSETVAPSRKLRAADWREQMLVFRKEADCSSVNWDISRLAEPDDGPPLVRDVKFLTVSLRVDRSPAQPFLWRNYAFPPGATPPFEGTMLGSAVHALRASSAAPSFFDEFTPPPSLSQLEGQRHVDGAVGNNNPSLIAVVEARRLWPNRPIDCLVSLGTGDPPPRPSAPGWSGVLSAIVGVTTNTESVDLVMTEFLPPDTYFRFNPIADAFDVAIDERREAYVDEMIKATERYLDDNDSIVQKLSQKLLGI